MVKEFDPSSRPTAPRSGARSLAILFAMAATALARPCPAAWTDLAPAHPFGSHPMAYAAGSIRPNHRAQSSLDASVADFWDQWKTEYLEQACGAGRRVVLAGVGSGNLTVSEARPAAATWPRPIPPAAPGKVGTRGLSPR